MKLYLVRHGRTELNEAGRFQPIDSALSEEGISQAKQIGERLADVTFDSVYSSDSARAVETAKYILPDVELKKTELLRPMKLPSEMIGLAHTDPKVARIYEEINRHMEDRQWHYSDEENFYDFLGRISRFLDYIPKVEGQSLAVTHSLVIRCAVCLVLLRGELNASIFQKLRWRLHATNTGITVLSFEDSEWRLETFNDVAHL